MFPTPARLVGWAKRLPVGADFAWTVVSFKRDTEPGAGRAENNQALAFCELTNLIEAAVRVVSFNVFIHDGSEALKFIYKLVQRHTGALDQKVSRFCAESFCWCGGG